MQVLLPVWEAHPWCNIDSCRNPHSLTPSLWCMGDPEARRHIFSISKRGPGQDQPLVRERVAQKCHRGSSVVWGSYHRGWGGGDVWSNMVLRPNM